MKTQIVAVIVVVAGVAVAAVVATLIVLSPGTETSPQTSQSSALRPASLTVRGTVTVRGDYRNVTANDRFTCSMGGGYSDIRQGAQVVVTDAAGTTIALGQLGPGWLSEPTDCVFPFTVSDVPAGHQFYGVEVSHRGRLQYTAAQVAAPIDLALGD